MSEVDGSSDWGSELPLSCEETEWCAGMGEVSIWFESRLSSVRMKTCSESSASDLFPLDD